MTTVSIGEFGANPRKHPQSARQGGEIDVTSKGVLLLATVAPPGKVRNAARTRLEQLAETAVIHDVVSPTGEWGVMGPGGHDIT